MSTLILYKDCKVLPERNFKVDDLSVYLDTLTSVEVDHFQFIKHSLNLTVKITDDQLKLEYYSANNYNYCSIRNTRTVIHHSKTIYYFIIGKKWLSESCIELTLRMDTINSFLNEIVLSDKTKILREHKNRFEKIISKNYTFTSQQVSSLQDGKFYRFKALSSLATGFYKIGYPDLNGKFLIFDEYNNLLTEYSVSMIDVRKTRRISNIILETTDGDRKQFSYVSSHRYAFVATDNIVLSSKVLSSLDGYYSEEQVLEGYRPIVDFYSEGLHPVLFQKESNTIKDAYSLGDEIEYEESSFYLIYKTRTSDENAALDVYLCSDVEMPISSAVVDKRNGTLIVKNHTSFLFPYSSGNSEGSISFRKKGEYEPTIFDISANTAFWFNTVQKIGGGYIVQLWVMKWNSNLTTWEREETFELDSGEVVYTSIETIRINFSDWLHIQDLSGVGEDYFKNEPISGTSIKSINSLDRTDTRLVKVIKLPYSPTGLSKDEDGNYLFDENIWSIGSESGYQFLKLQDESAKFEKPINYFGISPYDVLNIDIPLQPTEKLKSMNYEPKLFHSDYYLPKVVYDSFSFEFHLEEFESNYPTTIEMSFVQTSTINSRFMFVFNEYQTIGRTKEDFYNILSVARNNELVLYNSSYLNYIRTGYNYDVKTKERNQSMQIASAIGKTIGSIAGFVVNPALGVGIATSTVLSYIATANSIAQSEQNIEQKLAQNKMQSISVTGSDDVDLMTYYTDNNKAMLKIYEVSEKLKKALFDLFYYQGYIADYLGIPNHNTRKYFNFISADIVFEKVPNLSEDIMEDIRQKYGLGITFLHQYGQEQWDFEQKFENWENLFYEGE